MAVQWVPVHHKVPGNKMADKYTKPAVEGTGPGSAVADSLRWETSLSHMARVSTEEQSHVAAQCITEHLGDPRRKYKPPPKRGLQHKLLRRVPKPISSRYYQLVSGHAVIGPYLKDRIHRRDDDQCWWCGGGRQQTCHHLFIECRAWKPQIRRLWKDIGKAQEWKYPRAPSGKWLWKEKSTEAVLAFLRDTRVGCVRAERKLSEDSWARTGSGDEGEEGGPGPPGQ